MNFVNPTQAVTKSVSFDDAWSFVRFGNMPDGSFLTEPGASDRTDTGDATLSIQDPAFDDSSWRVLNLPHDWAIEGPFRMDLPNETGKLPWEGIGWYRKQFKAPESIDKQRLYLDFDGAMARPKIYVNGKLAGQWAYGYSSFRIEITPFLTPGKPNTIAVRVENLPESTRWYPGAGIYRHVRLTTTPATAIAHWGVFVTSPKVSPAEASIEVKTEIDNADSERELSIESTVLDGTTAVATTTTQLTATSGISAATANLIVPQPKCWELESPHLYTLRTRVLAEDASLIDESLTPFGIRTIKWDPDKGFHLNGKKITLQGVCQHHDLGPLGSAVHTRAIERQIEILKEMGVNAIRTSHNPPAPEFLDLCDRMGVLVIDELFDIWKMQKYGKVNGYNIFWDEWHEKDAENWLRRDRNHPSIIAWSIGNEVAELYTPSLHWVPKKLRDSVRKFDPSRPVTAGSNSPEAATNGFQNTVDLFGVNYYLDSYPGTADANPDKALYGSETASTVSTRGEYFFPVDWDKSKGFYNFQVSSYDLYAPGWAYRPDLQFRTLDQNPRYAGEFVWTGFDYLGEPTPYNQDQTNALNFQNPKEREKAMEELKRLGNRAPSRSSYFGIVDLAGFPKDRFYLYQSRWRPELPMAYILPHWNWPERRGQNTPVHVYTSGDEGELFLNGKSLGVRKKEPGDRAYRLVWDELIYQPGELKVVVKKDGKSWATATTSTTGKVTALRALADRPEISADGSDLSYITIRAVDSEDRTVPRSKNPLTIAAEGPIEIIGICNGDPTDFTTMKPADPGKAQISIFNGLAQVVVRSKKGEPGKARLGIASPGISSVILELTTK